MRSVIVSRLAARLPRWFMLPLLPRWLVPQQGRTVLFVLLLASLLLRLPFFFTSTDGYIRDAAITFHDEAIFMQIGRNVLEGHLPYLQHWDNASPLLWFIYAFIMFVSGGTLTGFRIFGALYIGVTAYVVFRCMADRQKMACAWWSAIFYLIFASTLQAAQSFTFEHLIGLPFALLTYVVLNGHALGRWAVLGLFGLCSWLMPSFVWMAPAIAGLCPFLFSHVPHMPVVTGWRMHVQPFAARLWPFMVRWLMLLCAAASGYAVCGLFYALIGEMDYYFASVFGAPSLLMGKTIQPILFFQRYFAKITHSSQWLLALFMICFLIKGVLLIIQRRAKDDILFWQLLLLMACALLTLYARGNHNALFLFYVIQVMPIFALVMGYTINFNLADLRWFVLAVSLVGLHNTSEVVLKAYSRLASYVASDHTQSSLFYGDRLYRVAEVMSVFPLEGETLIVCGEDDMLYLITGMENPRYFYFPFYHYNAALQKNLDHAPQSIRGIVQDKKPLYIVGLEGDMLTNRGFADMGDILHLHYVQVANVEGTIIFLRKDKLQNIFAE